MSTPSTPNLPQIGGYLVLGNRWVKINQIRFDESLKTEIIAFSERVMGSKYVAMNSDFMQELLSSGAARFEPAPAIEFQGQTILNSEDAIAITDKNRLFDLTMHLAGSYVAPGPYTGWRIQYDVKIWPEEGAA